MNPRNERGRAVHSQRGHSSRIVLSVAGSLFAGLAAAIVLVVGPMAGGSEASITGSVLFAFGLGWGVMALSSTRLTDQPQRWALVPAAAMSFVGFALILLQPTADVMGVLAWIWPAAVVVLVGWMVIQARRALGSRTRRWMLYPVFGVLVLFAIGGTAEAVIHVGARDVQPMRGELVSVGDHRLHIDCTGTGSPTVVLESGLAESSFYWARIAEAIAPTTTVCAYDRAGRGWSEASPEPQDGLAVANDLHALLSASGTAGPYVLVGHSTGGNYVRIFAAAFPNEVAGMVLLDSQPADAFTSLPNFPAFYSSTHAVYALLPSVARLGVLRLAYGSAFGDLPAAARDAERADQASTELQASQRDEMAQLATTLRQAQALTSLGDRPLVVVTAAVDAQAGWMAAQDRMVGLSTNAAHRVMSHLDHTALITSEAGAAASSLAILDVVTAVRTGAALADG